MQDWRKSDRVPNRLRGVTWSKGVLPCTSEAESVRMEQPERGTRRESKESG